MLPCHLILPPDATGFITGLHRLRQCFTTYAETSPQPLPAPGLVITREIRLQSELYLPIDGIRRLFYRLYRTTLSFSPVFCSSPFHNAVSWADCYVSFPSWLQFSPDPSVLLERLLEDRNLLQKFIFYSFLPGRFNGAGFDRYPEQLALIREFFINWRSEERSSLRCLDAASGTGEGSWQLAEILSESGWKPEQTSICGWTLEPLEVWAAENLHLPHDPERERACRQRIDPLIAEGWGERISFKVVDLLKESNRGEPFDLILCNGLLGGPIIDNKDDMQQIATRLSLLKAPGGQIMVASRFHDGWKKRFPEAVIDSMITGLD